MTIQDWIDALLSGKYSQTKHRLRDGRGFCCLGVACDVKDSSGWGFYERDNPYTYHWKEESHMLSKQIQDELDLDDVIVWELSNMNDGGKTFAKIAERIREYAEEKQGAQTC